VAALLAGALALGAAWLAAQEGAKADVLRNPLLEKLEPNRWALLHEQKPGDAVRFRLQEHGGGCFDTRRGRVVLFGSNTHGKDWANSPLVFDVARMEWTRLYPDDSRETYRADEKGLAVAGGKGDHPWAMHTFGAVEYDPGRDEMVVCCYPAHMVPGRFSDALKDVWGTVRKHPTWTFRFAENRWVPLDCDPVHFFPYATAFDPGRGVIVGYGGPGIWELGGEPRKWTKILGDPKLGWHNNMVVDTKNRAVVVFGTHQNGDEVVVYRPDTREHRVMPTPGPRPPRDQHNPMSFDESAGRTVVVVDREGETREKVLAETWLYDLGTDSWMRLPDATLPFGCGMNYTLFYDPRHKANLLVCSPPGKSGSAVSVFALRIDLAGVPRR